MGEAVGHLAIVALGTVMSVACMIAGAFAAAIEWDPFTNPSFPYVRALLYGYTLIFMCTWFAVATKAWWLR